MSSILEKHFCIFSWMSFPEKFSFLSEHVQDYLFLSSVIPQKIFSLLLFAGSLWAPSLQYAILFGNSFFSGSKRSMMPHTPVTYCKAMCQIPSPLGSRWLLPALGRRWHPGSLGTLFPMGLWFYDSVGKARHALHCGFHRLPPICLFTRNCIWWQRNQTIHPDTLLPPPRAFVLLRFNLCGE